MRVLITGTSRGIGKATAELFLKNGFEVYGMDVRPSTIKDDNYYHIIGGIGDMSKYPSLSFDYIVHNAGVQDPEKSIKINLVDTIQLNEFLLKQSPNVKAITFNTSISAVYGDEFPEYVASKAGLNGYMKNTAKRLQSIKGVSNAVCFGGVKTELNAHILEDKDLYKAVLDVNPLHRWLEPEEAAEWIYFVTVVNRFATGQAFEIDGGENSCPKSTFVW